MAGKFCLPHNIAEEVKRLLKSGSIDIQKISNMEPQARHDYFSSIVGEENATHVNGLFEREVLLKNTEAGAIRWAKTITGISEPIRRDLLSKIESTVKNSKENILNPVDINGLKQDLINIKLGLDVSFDEAKTITELTNKLTDSREVFNKTGNAKEYGASKVALERYLSELKSKTASGVNWKNPFSVVKYIMSNTKALVASLDDSFAGRQGIKALPTHPVIWVKSFIKSFNDLARGFKNGREDVIDALKADVYSMENSMNGTFDRMKLAIGGIEEAYTPNIISKIPGLKRPFEASEAAYEAMGIRLRTEIANHYIDKLTETGVDFTDINQAESFGKLINSLTGRGDIGKLNAIGEEINVAFFSAKFLKGNIDVLTAHSFDGSMSPAALKSSRINIMKIVGTTAFTMYLANQLWPGSVDSDPRSSNFGKIKIKDSTFDITGGMASLVTLASRLVLTKHNGEWGFWTKSGSSGLWTDLTAGKFGKQTALNIIEGFSEGKLSPMLGLLRDIYSGQNYNGEKITPTIAAKQVFMPLIAQTGIEAYKDPNSAPLMAILLTDFFGISTNTRQASNSDWNTTASKEVTQFKDKFGTDKLNEANKRYNTDYGTWWESMKNNDRFKSLSDEDKSSIITKKKANLKEVILKSYGFKYKEEKKPAQEKSVIKQLSK